MVAQSFRIHHIRQPTRNIDAVLNASAYVRQAIVIAKDRPGGDKLLVAYVVPENGFEPGFWPNANG